MYPTTKVSNRKRTTNDAIGCASTLDAFDGLSQQTDWNDNKSFAMPLQSSEHKPATTIEIISGHEGKSERDGSYRARGWLYHEYTRPAFARLPAVVEPLIERERREKKDRAETINARSGAPK